MGIVPSAITRRGVILVSLQYRLGLFGFMSHPALTAESPHHSSGNYALLDLVAGLRWVAENIEEFGGDPANVTIFGHSAGAQNVGLLMLMPLARGLFHRAIAQSGTAGFGQPPRTLSENEMMCRRALMQFDPSFDGLHALRDAPGEALLEAADALMPPESVDPTFVWLQPIVDGWVLPDAPGDILARRAQAPVPLIIGTNVKEFPVARAEVDPKGYIRDYFLRQEETAFSLYDLASVESPSDDPHYGSVADQISADVVFRGPARWVTARQREATAKVWRYELAVAAPNAPAPAIHASELPFVFEAAPDATNFGSWPPLQAYWANFAKCGDPNGDTLPLWPPADEPDILMEFTADGPRPGRDRRAAICALLERP